MKQRMAAFAFFAVAGAVLAVAAAWCESTATATSSNQAAVAANASPGVAQPAAPLHPSPALVILEPQYPGRWAWDPVAGTWYWQLIVAPPSYVVYSYPYWPAYWYPHWIVPPRPRGRYTFTPNPDYENTISGMLFLPPKEPPMTFQPGESPAFPWARSKPTQGQNQASGSKARPSQPGAVSKDSDESSQPAPDK